MNVAFSHLGEAVTSRGTPASRDQRGPAPRRVRQEARDALGVVLFSAAASTVVALVIMLVAGLAG